MVTAYDTFHLHPTEESTSLVNKFMTGIAAAAALSTALVVGAGAPAEAGVPRSYQNALAQAESYVRSLDISKAGLYEQLHSEYGSHFPADAAHYGANHVKANWSHEALGAATAYVHSLDISKAGLSTQLTSENGSRFTRTQARYAIKHVRVDYDTEALGAAKAYEKSLHLSDAALYDQLTSEYGSQFTASQAHYAIDHL